MLKTGVGDCKTQIFRAYNSHIDILTSHADFNILYYLNGTFRLDGIFLKLNMPFNVCYVIT